MSNSLVKQWLYMFNKICIVAWEIKKFCSAKVKQSCDELFEKLKDKRLESFPINVHIKI